MRIFALCGGGKTGMFVNNENDWKKMSDISEKTYALLRKLRARRAAGEPVRVLFVCLGNICRSPAADGLMRALTEARGDSSGWVIDSAGTGNYHIGDLPDQRMRVHARRRGYTLDHRCRQVREADFDDFDIIFGMDASNLANLRRIAPTPEAAEKVVPMGEFFSVATSYDHVPDPYYEGSEGFELVLDLLESATQTLYDEVTRHEAE